MKVKKIFEEDWEGAHLRIIENDSADLDRAYSALDCLDGKTRTSIQFSAGDDAVLTVGGNGEKFVVCAAYEIDVELYTLIDPAKSASDYEDIVIGGQSGVYPSNQVVDKKLAKEAISYFCDHGKISPNLDWQHE